MIQQETLKEMTEYAATQPMLVMRKILESRLEQYRTKNDSATIEEVPANQGAIRELKHLIKLITPQRPIEKRDNWDGGFN